MAAGHEVEELALFHLRHVLHQKQQGLLNFLVVVVGLNAVEHPGIEEGQVVGQGIDTQHPEPLRPLKQIRGAGALFPVLNGLFTYAQAVGHVFLGLARIGAGQAPDLREALNAITFIVFTHVYHQLYKKSYSTIIFYQLNNSLSTAEIIFLT